MRKFDGLMLQVEQILDSVSREESVSEVKTLKPSQSKMSQYLSGRGLRKRRLELQRNFNGGGTVISKKQKLTKYAQTKLVRLAPCR